MGQADWACLSRGRGPAGRAQNAGGFPGHLPVPPSPVIEVGAKVQGRDSGGLAGSSAVRRESSGLPPGRESRPGSTDWVMKKALWPAVEMRTTAAVSDLVPARSGRDRLLLGLARF